MSEYDTRHDGNGAFEDRDSRHKQRPRDRHLSRDTEKDGDRHFRGYKDRSLRGDRGRDSYGYESRCSRDHDRNRVHDQDRERRRENRSPPRSKDRSRNQFRSRSPSKSKRASGFDVAPPAADMLPGAAISGKLPGIPQTTPAMFQNAFSFGASQLGSLPVMPMQAMTQQATRHARRVYVGGLPPLANEQTIATFFSHVMVAIGGNSAGPGEAVVNVYINHEKKFAFVEMRTVEEASNAMSLDGIIFEGVSVRVRRPTDYNPVLASTLGPSQASPHLNLSAVGLIPGSIGGAEGLDRVFVGGIPYYFTEAQIRKLLDSFGPLRGFDLVKDRDTGNSKGYGFCIYQDPAVTDVACAALNGLKMGDKTLTVRRATASGAEGKSDQENILAHAQQHIEFQKMALQAGGLSFPVLGTEPITADAPTKVLCLNQAISADDLKDEEEFKEILDDMRDECGKFGALANIVIPRPNPNGDWIPGTGKVFLEYNDIGSCVSARNALNGRKFGGNTVSAVYYPEETFHKGDYSA